MTTLKELKAMFPDKITTSGSIYRIDGFGLYRQRKTSFGIDTYWKDMDDEWKTTSFSKLVEDIKRIYK